MREKEQVILRIFYGKTRSEKLLFIVKYFIYILKTCLDGIFNDSFHQVYSNELMSLQLINELL